MITQQSEELSHPLKKIWPVMQELEDSDSGLRRSCHRMMAGCDYE